LIDNCSCEIMSAGGAGDFRVINTAREAQNRAMSEKGLLKMLGKPLSTACVVYGSSSFNPLSLLLPTRRCERQGELSTGCVRYVCRHPISDFACLAISSSSSSSNDCRELGFDFSESKDKDWGTVVTIHTDHANAYTWNYRFFAHDSSLCVNFHRINAACGIS
jgi:hypothetical protein